MANILYLGCHQVLEFDDLKLFTEMGHAVFSLAGVYQDANSEHNMRPDIPGLFHNEHLSLVGSKCSKENIDAELLDWADVVLMTHNGRVDVVDHPQPWLGSTPKNSKGLTGNNWEKFKKAGKPVVWRSIGQSIQPIEESLKPFRDGGLKIVRYSPMEKYIPKYVGEDAMIRFYKDPQEYTGWTGTSKNIVNISQAMFGDGKVASRGDHMSLNVFKKVVEDLPWKIFGPNNANAGLEHDGGKLTFEDLKTALRFNRVFFYSGTRPASYTLGFIEAMLTGIPIVSIGPKLGNEIYNQQTFEAHEIIGENGIAGFWSDDPRELREYCKRLLEDDTLAQNVSEQGRLRAIQYFGREGIKDAWNKFFQDLGIK